MERTSKGSGFKMRSGNKPTMSKLAGITKPGAKQADGRAKSSAFQKQVEYRTEGDRVLRIEGGKVTRINNPEKDKVYQAYLKKQRGKKYLEDKKEARRKELENLRNEEEGTRQNF